MARIQLAVRRLLIAEADEKLANRLQARRVDVAKPLSALPQVRRQGERDAHRLGHHWTFA